MLMMSLFSLYFQQVCGLRFYPAAYRSARIVTTPTLQVDRNHRHHRNHLRAKNNQKPIQAVPKKQSGLVFLYYFNILFIIVSSSPARDSMNAYGYSGDGGYGGDGQMYNGGQAAQPSMLHMGRNKHRHPTHRRNRCIARKYKEFRRTLCHAADEVPACVVTVVTVVTVNCMVRAAKGAAIGSACGWEHPKHPARRMNRCIARKYKGFRRTLCHAADEVPACVVTVVTVVSVNCMVRAASCAAIGSACGREHFRHPVYRQCGRCNAGRQRHQILCYGLPGHRDQ
jgi:hypothetical protein